MNNPGMDAACDEVQSVLSSRIEGVVGFVVVTMQEVEPGNTRLFVDWRTKLADADSFLDMVAHLAEESKGDGEPWVKS